MSKSYELTSESSRLISDFNALSTLAAELYLLASTSSLKHRQLADQMHKLTLQLSQHLQQHRKTELDLVNLYGARLHHRSCLRQSRYHISTRR